MKLNKLLTPILGLATVSTVVAPIATSCSSETSADHVKISNKSEEVTPNSSGLANYLFVLDSHDYDVHGFKVSTTVDKKDTTGVVDSDFTTTWEIDGDHLLVHVQYEGEEAPEEDVAIKLNIHIYYGTEWNKTFDVKLNYQANKGQDMPYYEQGTWLGFSTYDSKHEFVSGENISFTADLSKMPADAFSQIATLGLYFYFDVPSSESTIKSEIRDYIYCGTIAIYVDGKEVEQSGNYQTYPPQLIPSITINGVLSVSFLDNFYASLKKTSKITFECKNIHTIVVNSETETLVENKSCIGYVNYDNWNY